MKGENFAKIFETKNGQVLVRKDYCHTRQKHQLVYSMEIEGLCLDLQMASKLNDEDLAQKDIQTLFENSDLDSTTKVSNLIIKQLT